MAPPDDAVVVGLVGANDMGLFADVPESEDPELEELEDDPWDMAKSLWLLRLMNVAWRRIRALRPGKRGHFILSQYRGLGLICLPIPGAPVLVDVLQIRARVHPSI